MNLRSASWALTLASTLPLGASGCLMDTGADAHRGELVSSDCSVQGEGTTASGATFSGQIHGDGDELFTGTWSHDPADGPSIAVAGEPTFLTCRINGAILADFELPVVFDGEPDHTLRISVQDRASAPTGEVTRVERLEATKRYDPDRRFDGFVNLAGGARFDLPEQLSVTVGNGGHHWAELRYHRLPEDDEVHCCYRGGSAQDNPVSVPQIERGLAYELAACTTADVPCEEIARSAAACDDRDDSGGRRGRGASDRRGNGSRACGASASGDAYRVPILDLEAGDTIHATWINLSVRDGADRFPSTEAPQTTIELTLPITTTETVPDPDLYRAFVQGPDGSLRYRFDGEVASGDISIEL